MDMAKIKILEHTAVITGVSFEDCKAEYDRVIEGVEKDFKEECGLRKWIFSDMIQRKNECTVIFRIPSLN